MNCNDTSAFIIVSDRKNDSIIYLKTLLTVYVPESCKGVNKTVNIEKKYLFC